jgi:hypothetical protein
MALFTTHLALLSVAQPQHLSGSSGASIVVRSSSRLLLEVEGEGTDCSRWRWLGRWRFWSVRPVSRFVRVKSLISVRFEQGGRVSWMEFW